MPDEERVAAATAVELLDWQQQQLAILVLAKAKQNSPERWL